MLTEIQLKTALNSIIKGLYPKAHIYGQGATEKFLYPAFFIEIRLNGCNDATANIVEKNYMVYITYIPKTITEEDNFIKVNEIRDGLKCTDDANRHMKMYIKVASDNDNKYIQVKDYSFTFIGEAVDTLQISFTLSFFDFYDPTVTEKMMEHVVLTEKLETEE